MKTILIYLACSSLFMNICLGNNRYDNVLTNIQQKVMDAFVQAKIVNSDKDMVSIEQSLLKLNESNSNEIIAYWYSYACYYHSIFFMIGKDSKSSEKILDDGIKMLNDIRIKNSEHFALLSLMESLSIQYASGIEIPFISKRVKQNAESALQLDTLNLRAYYVLGANDFYTPQQYGGGKKAEYYLKKAISLSSQTVSNPYLPSWGKNSAYEMLIRLYINNKQFDEAKKYFQQAKILYPDDYMINSLAVKLINN